MAKLLKSIFNTAERRKAPQEGEEEDEKHVTPPMDSRRQLSISRSGRLRQANKKRHSLTLELYGDVSIPTLLHILSTDLFILVVSKRIHHLFCVSSIHCF